MCNSAITFGDGWEGHVVARWEMCEPRTINLLTVGFGEGVGLYEFIDNNDQLWGVCIQWPDTIEQHDILAFGYRMERMLRRCATVAPNTFDFEIKLTFFLPECRFEIVPLSPDFEWGVYND